LKANSFSLIDTWVLLVENRPDTAFLLAFALEAAGAEVLIADSIDEAIKATNYVLPSILVGNIELLSSNSFFLFNQLREICYKYSKSIPAIAIVPADKESELKKPLAPYFDLCVLEFEPEQLVEEVITLLSK
jgi:DNA-binding response OmpR family regulator